MKKDKPEFKRALFEFTNDLSLMRNALFKMEKLLREPEK